MEEKKKTDDFWLGVMAAIVGMPALILLIAASYIVPAIVLSTVWNWTMVPAFRLPELNLAKAMAVSVVANLVVPRAYVKDTRKWWEQLIAIVVVSVFSIVLAWILHFYL